MNQNHNETNTIDSKRATRVRKDRAERAKERAARRLRKQAHRFE